MSWASRHNLLARAVNANLGGVPVTWGAVSGVGIFEENSQLVIGDQVISIEYALHNLPTAQFGNLMYGDELRINNTTYQVRELMRVGDGSYCMVSLQRLDPGTSAIGRNPREGLRLDDLADVDVSGAAANDQLTYDGQNWVDRASSIDSKYVHTQATPASVWTIAHNLGFKPSVELMNAASHEIDGDVIHLSNNVCQVLFTLEVSGFARLN